MDRKMKIPTKAMITPRRKCNRSLLKNSTHWLLFFREADRFLLMFFFAVAIGYSFRSEKNRVLPANLHDNFQFTQPPVKIPYSAKSDHKFRWLTIYFNSNSYKKHNRAERTNLSINSARSHFYNKTTHFVSNS